ncbi:NUDIX hydrolase [Natrarchaeobaculum aegyptiacum]|uniref:Coenzyme A pyrophosphatase n=1 Tax=Natrarchaeobaculum aegyptiacum TaxID=745377 RepID=A0A2Z2HSX9_9EURY|nr:CoA pyrophosphatase [Natrarchaeobaculum aegyptiacum]ARS90232.1 coenzyme A pyrophosphatase [Natrarchaeobaculum aegyptiacum]
MARLNLDPVAAHEPTEIDDQPNDAAVLAPIVDRDGEDYLLFTRRADHLGEHPGQMSFPGGGAEPEDDSILETALREAKEEIGLDPGEAEVVGQLDDIRTISEYAVTPFVAHAPDRTYDPDDGEVAEIVTLPLSGLLDPANFEYERRDDPHYGEIVVHYFHVDGYTVWGATGRMLVQLLELATDFEAPEPSADSRL